MRYKLIFFFSICWMFPTLFAQQDHLKQLRKKANIICLAKFATPQALSKSPIMYVQREVGYSSYVTPRIRSASFAQPVLHQIKANERNFTVKLDQDQLSRLSSDSVYLVFLDKNQVQYICTSAQQQEWLEQLDQDLHQKKEHRSCLGLRKRVILIKRYPNGKVGNKKVIKYKLRRNKVYMDAHFDRRTRPVKKFVYLPFKEKMSFYNERGKIVNQFIEKTP
ncbi:MAG: hypothetical protein EP338_08205 [Bacteroidetes bacterium]|nr:MAG: hypothetical protein EP338_08205 [Bacteroidota bacterium]